MKAPVIITGRMVLIGFIAFFGLIIVVNATFAYFAVDSWPGLVSKKAYQDGTRYNETIKAARIQTERGWSSTFSTTSRGEVLELSTFILSAENTPVSGLDTTAVLRRPVNDAVDITVRLSESMPGAYAASVTLPLRGRWYVVIKARDKDADVYQMEHEIMVQP